MSNVKDIYKDSYYLFVYGTLLRNLPRNPLLFHNPLNRYVGQVQTVNKRYGMALHGSGFPAIFENHWFDKAFNGPVKGELYHLRGNTVKLLDKVESNGSLYQRTIVKVEPLSKIRDTNYESSIETYVLHSPIQTLDKYFETLVQPSEGVHCYKTLLKNNLSLNFNLFS